MAEKEAFGNELRPKVRLIYPDHAGAITGMILELENSEIQGMLTHPALLSAGINDAMGIINKNRKDRTNDIHASDGTTEGAGDQMDLSHRPTSADVENLFDTHPAAGAGIASTRLSLLWSASKGAAT